MLESFRFYDIIAKSDGTSLMKHSFESYKISEFLLESNKQMLENWSKLLNINNFKPRNSSVQFTQAKYLENRTSMTLKPNLIKNK